MRLINDDPIIRCMERTGYPPWMLRSRGEDREDGTDGKDDDDE